MRRGKKVFLVFNTACFGDNLVCNALCQNIKLSYPDAKVVFVVNKPFYEAAKYQKDVDDVIILDKKGQHKGVLGLIRFILQFPYKKAYAAFITYANFRNCLISAFTGCFRIFQSGNIDDTKSAQEQILDLFANLDSNKIKNVPIVYNATKELPPDLKKCFRKDEKYVALCVLTKNPPKDMSYSLVLELVRKLIDSGYKPVLTGSGESIEKFAIALFKDCDGFVNLVNKTSIYELACVLKNCVGLISVDTGTMHLGYAVGVPTVAVFFEQTTLGAWAPNEIIYNVKVVSQNQTADNIVDEMELLIKKESKIV